MVEIKKKNLTNNLLLSPFLKFKRFNRFNSFCQNIFKFMF